MKKLIYLGLLFSEILWAIEIDTTACQGNNLTPDYYFDLVTKNGSEAIHIPVTTQFLVRECSGSRCTNWRTWTKDDYDFFPYEVSSTARLSYSSLFHRFEIKAPFFKLRNDSGDKQNHYGYSMDEWKRNSTHIGPRINKAGYQGPYSAISGGGNITQSCLKMTFWESVNTSSVSWPRKDFAIVVRAVNATWSTTSGSMIGIHNGRSTTNLILDENPASSSQETCSDTCGSNVGGFSYSGDGVCDDGGPGSEYNVCDLGTDCTDCGVRPSDKPPVLPTGPICNETCSGVPNTINTSNYSGDGVCDDGGPGSDYNICDLGTDCRDCGVRYL